MKRTTLTVTMVIDHEEHHNARAAVDRALDTFGDAEELSEGFIREITITDGTITDAPAGMCTQCGGVSEGNTCYPPDGDA